ncbi:hypothetical protein BHE90_013657 [Fusarium euwallaceae]|uniref:DUF7730 domain-containing protein n=2 Tax=Fusarium solani species complex TaxID=232080 RepID=A0A430L8D2_9HYPO|nr:hypothetical protein CEP51_015158 [Fusarium floridanum]RTE71930.1 hypothetical protein BHE90_013657 [Fusarium euwallaceae]
MSEVSRFSKSSVVQDGSPFFTKFPPEIRRFIYGEAFGNRRVHIVPKETHYINPLEYMSMTVSLRWTHHVCVREIPGNDDAAHPHFEDKDKSCRLAVQILRTCKQVYEEGVHLLYKSNVFSFDGGHNMNHFQDTFLPANLIRSIEVYSNTMILGNHDVRPMTRELDTITKALKKRQTTTPLELRLNFSVKRRPNYDPRKPDEMAHERAMGGLVACFAGEFLCIFFDVDRCRLDIDLHCKLHDGFRNSLERVAPVGPGVAPVNLTLFHYDEDEDEDEDED